MKITAIERPFVLASHQTGTRYLLTSADAQRLLDTEAVVSATVDRVVLPGHRTLQPATLGGGPAFIIERGEHS